MRRDVEDIKKVKKLSVLLPKILKSVMTHIVMHIYHVSMPPWVAFMKVKRVINSYSTDDIDNKTCRHMNIRRIGRKHRIR